MTDLGDGGGGRREKGSRFARRVDIDIGFGAGGAGMWNGLVEVNISQRLRISTA